MCNACIQVDNSTQVSLSGTSEVSNNFSLQRGEGTAGGRSKGGGGA